MRRQHVLIALAVLLVAAVIGAVFALGGTDDPATRPSADPTPTSSAEPPATAEQAFLHLTVAHLCSVQAKVYPDPAALAEAYDSVPAYPGLTEDEVADLQRQLDTDPDLARRLNQLITEACTG